VSNKYKKQVKGGLVWNPALQKISRRRFELGVLQHMETSKIQMFELASSLDHYFCQYFHIFSERPVWI